MHLFRKERDPHARPTQAEQITVQPEPAPRTHLEGAPYLLPKDAEEDQRLNFQHHILYRTLSNHYLAPLGPTTTTILDVGCGTGIWSADMAVLFPQAQILGIDITLKSLPDPLPARCLFAQANLLHGLPLPDRQFAYTHQRLLVAAIPATRWPGVIRELVRVTRPGGWVELLELGDTIEDAGPATKKLVQWMTRISKTLGFEMRVLERLGAFLQAAGCDSVSCQNIPVPLGDWAGTSGQMLKTDVISGWSAVKETYCPLSQTPPEAFDEMLHAAVNEWEQTHPRYVFHAYYARRSEKG